MKYTNQSAFDRMVEHLFTQGKPCSTNEVDGHVRCYYRVPEGLGMADMKCAVGALIEDDEYEEVMEDLGEVENMYSQIKLPSWDDLNIGMLSEVQTIHDNSEPKTWYADLKQVAKDHNLSTEVLDKYEGVKL